jgi:hypothetical protein
MEANNDISADSQIYTSWNVLLPCIKKQYQSEVLGTSREANQCLARNHELGEPRRYILAR